MVSELNNLIERAARAKNNSLGSQCSLGRNSSILAYMLVAK